MGNPTGWASDDSGHKRTVHEEMREVALEISQRDPASPLRR